MSVVLRGGISFDSLAWGGSAHAERWAELAIFCPLKFSPTKNGNYRKPVVL